MQILGLSAYYHDSAAALVRDGRVVAAAQEERFSRIKHDPAFPSRAVQYCMEMANNSPIDYVVFYDKPFLKFERILETYLSFAPKGFATFRAGLPVWAKEKLFQRSLLLKELKAVAPGRFSSEQLLFSEHHLSHAASAFYPSPFEDALVITMDGVGERSTTSVGTGNGADLQILRELDFPHSLGLLYSAFTTYTGFKVNSGEYKLMGLAPYGQPRFAQTILDNLIDLRPDGSFRLDQRYFSYCTDLRMFNTRFTELFGEPARRPEAQLTQFHADIAASIQHVTETVVLSICRAMAKETGQKNLCLAGGVALNCVANGKIAAEGLFENIWIQPAAGDSGGAIGAALAASHLHLKLPRSPLKPDGMASCALGPEFSQSEIEDILNHEGAKFLVVPDNELWQDTATALANGEVTGWFQGRMEFGPRALGQRSILADPRDPAMQKKLNLKIKFRESFRPFAPSVLEEDAADWFDLSFPASPYMLMVTTVSEKHRNIGEQEAQARDNIIDMDIPRSDIPAVTHTDFSARLQTVSHQDNPRYYELLQAFKKTTGCPILINTSFNVRGEPIVATPAEAFRCFMATDMDRLVIGNCVLKKSEQNQSLATEYHLHQEAD
ncbi:carbamoyltransferase [Thalassospira povalilytica]|uniref:carbamoyltransferase family protein n=1 Tax=Thalassospira povalilytica TaxID=732237 RepID=UPI003AA8A345